MDSSSGPLRDPARLAALADTKLLDSAAEEGFDRLTRLVTRLLGVPVALISLVDDNRQFFKSIDGLKGTAGEARQTPLSHSFCQHVVIERAPLIVTDAQSDLRVCDNLAIPELGVKSYLGVPLTLPSGHVIGSLCAIGTRPRMWTEDDVKCLADIAEIVMSEIGLRHEIARRQDADSNQALLIAELHHRVKNTLSTVQALIQLNLRSAPTLEAFRQTISGRIESLAKTHTLLTTKRWHAIAFHDILKSELAPYQQIDQVSFDGPDFDLEAEVATTIGMVIHELTTNAAKYGALSSPQGSIEIRWTVENVNGHEAKVTLTWRERGGPAIHHSGKKGFGSSLIERLIVKQFDGVTKFEFAPEGLLFHAAFTVPMAA
jgi:two-component sensor histidine kinase